MDRRPKNCRTLFLLAALGGVAPAFAVGQVAVGAASQNATQILLDKAHTLEARGRMDMAAQTWQQVLLADQNNTEALGGLARAAKLSRNQVLSNTYLQRLRAVSPNDPAIARTENMLTKSSQSAQLQQAGRLAASGDNAGAMAIYRRVFGDTPPAGDWALAYYETEAGTTDGRTSAITGLRSLAEKHPTDTRYQIALGRMLTYSPATRAEGRKLLQKYPKDTSAVAALTTSNTFDSDGAGKGDEKSRKEVRPAASSTVVTSQRAIATEERAAYAALNAKRFAEADSRFAALLRKRPHDARALAGMGYVRVNQQNFAGAISFLGQATENGATDAGLDRNLALARFYFALSEGAAALNDGDLTTAEAKYREALRMRPRDPEALQGLGATLLKAGQPGAAVPFFLQATRAPSSPVQPGPVSWRGLFVSQFQAGDVSTALLTEQRTPPAIHAQLMLDPEYLRNLAAVYLATGRQADAQRVLRSALALPFPRSAKGLKTETELQYANLLLQANELDQAAGLYRDVLVSDPDNVFAWQGLVNTQHAMGDDTVALATLQSMPTAVRDSTLRDSGLLLTVAAVYQSNGQYDTAQTLLERAVETQTSSGRKATLQLQVQLAELYLQRNDAARALPIFQRVLAESPQRADAWKGLLSALHQMHHDREALAEAARIPQAAVRLLATDVQYLQTMGQVYAALGDSRQALSYLNRVQQRYIVQRVEPPADVAIKNAWLLYNTEDDAALYYELMYLGGRPDLNDGQRRTVQTIWASWAVRRANQASATKDTRRALAVLNAAAEAFPDNPVVTKALADGYVRAGSPKEAVAIFKAEDMSDESAGNYKIAIGAALAANDREDSEAWLRYALARYPHDAEILALAAKYEQARGRNGRAAEYYRASLAALPPPAPGTELAYLLHQAAPLNARALPVASQGLATLLAPTTEQPATQPYLPSDRDADAPTDLQDEQPQVLVPSYMSNPVPPGGRSAAPPRLDEPDAAFPVGGYQPPAWETPSPQTSASDEDKAFAVAAAQRRQAALRAAQQAQIRRANEAAALSDPTASGTGASIGTVVYKSRGEGAQTGEFNGEVYGPYVPYQPPTLQGRPAVSYSASLIDMPESTIVTDFPTSVGQAVPLRKLRSTSGSTGVVPPQEQRGAPLEVSQPTPNLLVAANTAPKDPAAELSRRYHGAQQPQSTLVPASGQIARPSHPAGAAAGLDRGEGNNSRQQYSRPKTSPMASKSASARHTTQRRPIPKRVEGFGIGNPPVFYPDVPTGLRSEPYPDTPSNGSATTGPQLDREPLARNASPSPRSVGRDAYPRFAGQSPLTGRQQIELDLAQLDAGYSGWAGGSGTMRVRSGEPGIDRLYATEIPVEATYVAGKTARFSIVPRAVFLNSGTINDSRYTAGFIPYLGTLPANAVNTPSPQFASGVGGELQVATTNLSLAFGYTPYEFLVDNVTARGSYRIAGGPVTVFGARDAIKETQLSYAGLRDPGSVSLFNRGNIWGGVVASGGGLRFDHGDERAGFYLSGDGAALTGFHVLENRRYEGTAGAYFRAHTFPGVGTLDIGAQLFAIHFAHNTRSLSYGNGGYFSPEVYFLGGVPVTFNGQYKGRLHYTLQGSLGVKTFQEDSAVLFPLDPALQTAAQANCSLAQLANRNCLSAFTPVNTSTGANFNIDAQFAYRITDHFFAGAQLLANNTNDFNVVQPGIFLRYTFRRQFATEDYPTGLFPILGFRPLRVP